MYTTPRTTLAMFIMVFVGVVRGLRGSIFATLTKNQREHLLCNVAATGLSLFAREHAKEFAV